MIKKILGFIGFGLLIAVIGLFIYGQATGKHLFGFLQSKASSATASTVFPSYYRFEPVSFTLSNNTTSPLPLGTTNPWKIVDGNGNLVYQPPTQATTTSFIGAKQWVWNQRNFNELYVAPGNYKVVFDSFGTSAPIVINSTLGSTGLFTFSFAGSTDTLTVFISNTRVIRDAIDNYYKKNTKHVPMGALLDDRPGKSPYDPQWSWQLDPSTVRMLSNNCGSITPSQVESNLAYYFPSKAGACFGSAQVASLDYPVVYLNSVIQEMQNAMPDVGQVVQIALNAGLIVKQEKNDDLISLVTVKDPTNNQDVVRIRQWAATVSGNTSGDESSCEYDNTGVRVFVSADGTLCSDTLVGYGQNYFATFGGANHGITTPDLQKAFSDAENLFNGIGNGVPMSIADPMTPGAIGVDVSFVHLTSYGKPDYNKIALTSSFTKIVNGHVTLSVYVNSNLFDISKINVGALTSVLEHELGHLYCLDHLSDNPSGSDFMDTYGNTSSGTPLPIPDNVITGLQSLEGCIKSGSGCQAVKNCGPKFCPANSTRIFSGNNAGQCLCSNGVIVTTNSGTCSAPTGSTGGGGGGGTGGAILEGGPATCSSAPDCRYNSASHADGVTCYSTCGGAPESCFFNASADCWLCSGGCATPEEFDAPRSDYYNYDYGGGESGGAGGGLFCYDFSGNSDCMPVY